MVWDVYEDSLRGAGSWCEVSRMICDRRIARRATGKLHNTVCCYTWLTKGQEAMLEVTAEDFR